MDVFGGLVIIMGVRGLFVLIALYLWVSSIFGFIVVFRVFFFFGS